MCNNKMPNTILTLNNDINIVKMNKSISNINNYIRDNTKISNEDKPFFIAIILISIKKESFRILFNIYNPKQYVYDLLKENVIEFGIDISIFEFLRNDDNNKHFYNIIKQVITIFDKEPTIDLLNMFYSEFVKYNNSDGKSLGIVLTPPHIVELMVRLLDINKNDIVLDLCTGTGSFLLESYKYNPKKIIGCEYQNKLYTLFKCNLIIRDINNYEAIKGDCFNNQFKATKSIINPPYGMKGSENEISFILKQLESVINDGLVSAILPLSNISINSKRLELTKIGQIITIIKCNKKLFYPYANVGVCILIIKKNNYGHDFSKDLVNVIDFDDDNIIRNRNSIPKRSIDYEKNINKLYNNIDNSIYKKLIHMDDDWLKFDLDIDNIDINNLKIDLINNEYHNNILSIKNNISNIKKIDNYKEFKISELFDIIKKPLIQYNSIITKKVPLISAKKINNGICDYINSNINTFTGNKIVLITGGDGGAGLAFYQENDFNISSATIVLTPKDDMIKLNKYTGIYIQNILSNYKKKYSRAYCWNISRIMEDKINLPISNGCINYEFIKNLFS